MVVLRESLLSREFLSIYNCLYLCLSVCVSVCLSLSLLPSALSRTPDIIIPGTLEAGYPSNLTCSVPWACEQGTPPTFSWMSTALTSLSSRTTDSSVLTFTPQPQDHGTKLTCLVTFSGAGVTVERTIQLNVTRKSGQMRELVLVAVGEATVKLLILGLCLVFLIVMFCRRKTTKLSVHMGCENPIKVSHTGPTHSTSLSCPTRDSCIGTWLSHPELLRAHLPAGTISV